MNQFKVVILDYPLKQLHLEPVKKIFNDMLITKQINFTSSCDKYISMDKHDMCGTHFLIYDTKDFLNPIPVLAIRTTYRKRAEYYNLSLPYENYYQYLSHDAKKVADDFTSSQSDLVDCNAWFVNPNYSKKNSGLDLSEIAYGVLCSFLLRDGYNHFVGCTNEKFKASRWLERVGEFPKQYLFYHPSVESDHMLILMNGFYRSWLKSCFQSYSDILKNCIEYRPVASEVSIYNFLETYLQHSDLSVA